MVAVELCIYCACKRPAKPTETRDPGLLWFFSQLQPYAHTVLYICLVSSQNFLVSEEQSLLPYRNLVKPITGRSKTSQPECMLWLLVSDKLSQSLLQLRTFFFLLCSDGVLLHFVRRQTFLSRVTCKVCPQLLTKLFENVLGFVTQNSYWFKHVLEWPSW